MKEVFGEFYQKQTEKRKQFLIDWYYDFKKLLDEIEIENENNFNTSKEITKKIIKKKLEELARKFDQPIPNVSYKKYENKIFINLQQLSPILEKAILDAGNFYNGKFEEI